MNTLIKKVVGKIRAPVMRFLKPKTRYFVFKPKRSLKPISTKFGFDRGKPIDRYYIEAFLEENKDYIKGVCLEITDNAYTKKFGVDVRVGDVLDISKVKLIGCLIKYFINIKTPEIKGNLYSASTNFFPNSWENFFLE